MSNEKICYGGEVMVGDLKLPISLAVEAGDLVYLSGCISLDNNFQPKLDCGIAEQTANTIEAMKKILAQAGCGLEDLVKMTVFIKDSEDFGVYNITASEFFPENPPARTTVVADFALEGVLIEIEATAYKPRG